MKTGTSHTNQPGRAMQTVPANDSMDKTLRSGRGHVRTPRNVTELIKAQEALRASEAALRTILDSINEAIFIHDVSGRTIDVNDKVLELFDVVHEEATQFSLMEHYSAPNQPIANLIAFWEEALKGQIHTFEWRCRRPHDGTTFDAEVYIRKIHLEHKDYVLVSVRNISRQKETEARLRELATKDDLTGTYNRRFFIDTLNQELERARRYGHGVAILMIDADNFKSVNDTYGHETGDEALRTLATIGKQTFRDVDVFARLGGEEFAVVLPETPAEKAVSVAERFRLATENTEISSEQGTLRITVSIGMAASTHGHCTTTELLKQADRALYRAKEQGRNRTESAGEIGASE